ncbi:hypothetical protein HELRODRAFT_189324 [Helobdella robusta]|uniref:SOCS box domain-containing protein n=1 Tax=Helobdella robusta TaxID=6412 RepID=T1FQY4_HELRO|nr:hypothetical protein HELRODRAFT_189324 [Helobdella robusta]ESN96644.1 hypothetical protein HELRODRAFT_189324 [Helobdella robusta]
MFMNLAATKKWRNFIFAKIHTLHSVSKNVQSDVVELLKQVLQWTPHYKPGLNTALIQAAKVGSLGCVRILFSAGAEIDTEDDNGDTPFVHAFRCRHVAIMEYLRDNGCNTEIAKMSLALGTKDIPFIKLCYSLDIPVENEDWDTVDPAEVRILMNELHLDPFQGQYGRHGFDDSPFMYVVQEGKPEIVKAMVLDNPNRCKYSEEEWNSFLNLALFRAIRNRRLDNVQILISELKAQLETRDNQGRTPFLVACGHDESISTFLLEMKADVNVVDYEGLTSLHWASCSGQKRTCASLLKLGLDPNCRANLGATPLMVACSNRKTEIVELFLNPINNHLLGSYQSLENIISANPDVRTPEGWTALHVAVRACAPSAILRSLLRHGANPDVTSSTLTHNGDPVPASTPLLIAIALNSLRMVQLLLNVNCDIDMPGLVHLDGVWGIKNFGDCLNSGSSTGGILSSSSPPSFSMSSSESESEDSKKYRTCVPIHFAVASRAWDIATILIRAGCKMDSIASWIETSPRKVCQKTLPSAATTSTVVTVIPSSASTLGLHQLPEDRLKQLRQLVWEATSAPWKLKWLCRSVIRRHFGKCDLMEKVERIEILPHSVKQYLLYYDLFKSVSNSFDV